MRKYGVLFVPLLIAFILCACAPRVRPVSQNDIQTLTVTKLETGESTACNREQVSSFLQAYNEATLYPKDVGTTHPYHVEITFTDGTKMDVWGDAQPRGFSSMRSAVDGDQNIDGQKLSEWFISFVEIWGKNET